MLAAGRDEVPAHTGDHVARPRRLDARDAAHVGHPAHDQLFSGELRQALLAEGQVLRRLIGWPQSRVESDRRSLFGG
jgi:hypothetical protein